MRDLRIQLMCVCIVGIALCARAEETSTPGILVVDCPAAGMPSGWRVENTVCQWQVDPERPGSALLTFNETGMMRLTSPAFLVRPGTTCGFVVSARADTDKAGTVCRIADTYRDEDRLLDSRNALSSEWTEIADSASIPHDKANPRFFTLEISAPKGATVGLGSILVRPDTSKPAQRYSASLALKPGASWGVYTPGERPLVRVSVAGGAIEGLRLRLRWTCTSGKAGEWTNPLKVGRGPLFEADFTDTQVMDEFGVYRVSAYLTGAGGERASQDAETLLARVPDPKPGPCPDSWFGVHVALREPDLKAVSKLGYKWCRIHDASGITKWGILEPRPGEWNWQDDPIALTRRYGFTIMGMLDSAPTWETGAESNGYFEIYHPPRDIEKWRNYVRNAVSHYKGAIDTWEVWNEPWDMARFFNGGTPGKYAELLKTAYEEAKAVHPECRIIGVDTYPAFWEAMVLANGAAEYYDAMSWHRYDSNMHGAPNDSIARVAGRLNSAQSLYLRKPKPLVCTEGGPDVSVFHGSFFSFMDPSVVGDWSRGADIYPRMFLSMIAAGNERFIAYSVHNETRAGQQTHMMTEPGYLLKPMHAALAALAHFAEGARYAGRKSPAPDVSALIFEHANPPSQVAVVYADGEDAAPLPVRLPEDVRCFDRWGNPCAAPTEATRSPVYCVADGKDLAAAFDPKSAASSGAATPDELLRKLAATLNCAADAPPLWTLFSPTAGLLSVAKNDGSRLRVTRTELRTKGVPEGMPATKSCEIRDIVIRNAGRFSCGEANIGSKDAPVLASFGLSKEGSPPCYRFAWLTLMTDAQPAANPEEIVAPLRHWEASLKNKSVAALYGTIAAGPACVTANTLNGEYFHFDRPEYLIGMMNTAVVWGVAPVSGITARNIRVSGNVAVIQARWDIASMVLGFAPFTLAGTLEREPGGWKVTAMTFGPLCAE